MKMRVKKRTSQIAFLKLYYELQKVVDKLYRPSKLEKEEEEFLLQRAHYYLYHILTLLESTHIVSKHMGDYIEDCAVLSWELNYHHKEASTAL